MDNRFITIGDTHGNHDYIRYMIKTQDINNTTLFHVGDFGIGFKKEHVDIAEMERLNEALEYKNNHLYVIRGNHDKPEWFDGTRDWSNLHLVPDYTIIDVNGFGVLMVGGAISIDRKPRLYDMQLMARKGIDKELYWYDENFVLDENKLRDIKGVTFVITHTAPKFVKPINNVGIPTHGYLVETFAADDPDLKADLDKEREDLTKMYEILKENNYILKWMYGHFHGHNAMYYEDTDFVMLNINEFYEVRL